MKKTEDQVRTEAGETLGFTDNEKHVKQGVGQLTSFNHLGFTGKGKNFKPDGWYLPADLSKPAIIFEAKSSNKALSTKAWKDEILRNVNVAKQKYAHVIGILYNGTDIRIWKDGIELKSLSKKLEHKTYYTKLFTQQVIDKQQIYNITKRINDSLHNDFKMTDLTDRMIFTACALVAQRYNPVNGLASQKGQGYEIVHTWITKKLAIALDADNSNVTIPNAKINVLVEEFLKISPSVTDNTDALDRLIDNVCEISDLVNSEYWNGEDVMAIFFNEFNRYRKKKEMGQILTPDHVTSFMYRLIDVNQEDRVLDAACGTGAFLVKSMCNMMKEAGGYSSAKSKAIRMNQLFGIEVDRRVFALACANMLIHKDGKTNLESLDSRLEPASKWIKSKGITKVLMNPPYERKYGCLKIVENVLNSVPVSTFCAFILPDKKLEKDGGWKILKHHTLKTIVKMPEDLFFGVGVTTSIFVFETGKPQGDKDIIGYYIESDGLETVKNKGRQDVKNRWPEKESYWIKAIQNGNDWKYKTRQIIHPSKTCLSYQMPEKPVEIHEEDFIKTIMDYEMFKRGIDVKEFNERLVQKMLYSSDITNKKDTVTISLEPGR